MDPDPIFDVTAVDCDDGSSATPSSGDPSSRTAIYNVDPGEMVTCTFTNTRRGSVIVASQTTPEGAEGNFIFTGVPSGTIPSGSTLVAADLSPGTYSATQVDPAPDFELAAIECDDGSSTLPSNGDPSSRTAVFNLDPGETIRCTFTNALADEPKPSAARRRGAVAALGRKKPLPAAAPTPLKIRIPASGAFPCPRHCRPALAPSPHPKQVPGQWSTLPGRCPAGR